VRTPGIASASREYRGIFTVIGWIDAERRWNWEKQLQAARPHLIQIIGTEQGADQFVADFLGNYDDPATCSTTTLHFTQGYVT
jgi:hypothetical protein